MGVQLDSAQVAHLNSAGEAQLRVGSSPELGNSLGMSSLLGNLSTVQRISAQPGMLTSAQAAKPSLKSPSQLGKLSLESLNSP